VEEKGGTGTKARLDDFPVAGKTGTAQKVNADGNGYSSKRIGSFVGFAPADAPRVVVLVLIDEPGTSSYGGVVAAPVFRAIANGALKRLGVHPAAPAVETAAAPATPPPTPRTRDAVVPVALVEAAGPATPNFIGLSLREALTRAQADGWQVRVTGTGYVAEQHPAPGAPLATERRLALRLVPEEAIASP
jgi:cell division protein FtsI (penicillin-binding protein 3)